MPEISEWLEKLGMSEYAQHFAENDIDFAILADLTDQDLEKIGVNRSAIAAKSRARSPSWVVSGKPFKELSLPPKQPLR